MFLLEIVVVKHRCRGVLFVVRAWAVGYATTLIGAVMLAWFMTTQADMFLVSRH